MSEAEVSPGVPSWDLHHRLARALEYAGVRVGEMGQYLEVSSKTMTNYLSGTTRPKDGALRAWALRCGVPFAWLKSGEMAPNKGPEGGSEQHEPSTRWYGTVVPIEARRVSLAALPTKIAA